MQQYFYIPKHYEETLFMELEKYFKKEGNFTCLTGVYQQVGEADVIDTTKNKVYSKWRTGNKMDILNGYEDLFENKKKYKLVAFCLEADLEKFVPLLYAQIKSLTDCFAFDTAEAYLAFINTNFTIK